MVYEPTCLLTYAFSNRNGTLKNAVEFGNRKWIRKCPPSASERRTCSTLSRALHCDFGKLQIPAEFHAGSEQSLYTYKINC